MHNIFEMTTGKNLQPRFLSPGMISFRFDGPIKSFAAAAAKSLQSCLTLCDLIDGAAHQAPSSLGFSRQEHWSGLPFPFPMHESVKWKWSHQSCPTLTDPMDCSLPGFYVHGIFQARVLEWGAIAFSDQEFYRQAKGENPAPQIQLYNKC